MSHAQAARQQALEVSQQVLRFDVKRRFRVLQQELQHLQNIILHRAGSRQAKLNAGHQPLSNGVMQTSSENAFLNRLSKAAALLQDEVKDDLEESERFRNLGLLLKSHRQDKAESVKAGPRPLGQDHLEVLWHAKMVHKATVIAERLHDLHNRVDQYLLRTNPDHPDPTLRRRTENGLGDRYLNELCRWTHRDLARFVVTEMGANYPYQEVPSTFQFWAYDFTSWHHSFISSKGHAKWRTAMDALFDPTRKPATPIDAGSTSGATDDDKEVPKFSMVALSYWMPERPTFHPIVAHELAHQVMRDLYGRELNLQILEHDTSQMSRLIRRIHRCAETWLARRDDAESKPPKVVSSLVQEIVCDLLALARFGSAYLYAWLLEILSDESFTALFHDRYGMIRAFPSEDCTQYEQARTQQFQLIQELKPLLHMYADELPKLYLRGTVLLRMAMSARGTASDDLADNFLEGFEAMLDLLGDIACAGDPARWEYNRAFAVDLATVVVRSRSPRSIDLTAKPDNKDDRLRMLKATKSPLAVAIQAWWAEPHDNGLKLQHMSEDMLALVNDALPHIGPGCPQTMGPMSIAQVPWRLEWLHSQAVVSAQAPGLVTPYSQTPEAKHSIALIRSLLMVGMEDYLRRTASPKRLLWEVAKTDKDKDAVSQRMSVSNSFLNADLLRHYDVSGVEALDSLLARRSDPEDEPTIELPAAHGAPAMSLALDRAMLARLLPPLTGGRTLGILKDADASAPARIRVLELFRLRNRTMLQGDIRVAPSAAATKPQDPSPPQLPPVRSGALLGRYDAFVLLDKEQVVETPQPQSPWEFRSADEGGLVAPANQPIYVSRSKRLIPVGGAAHSDRQPDTLALVMVSLRWEGARLPVARWLDSRRDELGRPQVYLSDGWEDLVLVMTSPHRAPDKQVVDGCERLFGLLHDLHDHPMVSSTETLLSPGVLKVATQCRLSAHFVCSFGPDGGSTDVWRQVRAIQKDFPECRALNLAGNKDIVVVAQDSGQLPELHRRLHGSLSDGARVETQVAWPDAEAHSERPAHRPT